jgi:hypothetical protein
MEALRDQAGSLCVYQRSTRQGLCTIIGVGSRITAAVTLHFVHVSKRGASCEKSEVVVALLGRGARTQQVLGSVRYWWTPKDSQWESRLLRPLAEFA